MMNNLRHIFICGCGHTGTSLLFAMLLAHKHIYGQPVELACFVPPNINLAKYMRLVLEGVQHSKYIILEKTPRHVYGIEYIMNNFKNINFLVCVRNPFDTIASLYKRFKNNHDIHYCIDRYINDNSAWISHYENSSHFRSITKIVRYEDVVDDTCKFLRNLCKFLDIEYDENMLAFHTHTHIHYFNATRSEQTRGDNEKDHVILRNWELHQPVSNMNGQWRSRINDEQVDEIKKRCRALSEWLGYDLSPRTG